MKNMKTNSPLAANEKKMTNHSARKTAVKKMQRKGLSRSDIIAINGHASEKGLTAAMRVMNDNRRHCLT